MHAGKAIALFAVIVLILAAGLFSFVPSSRPAVVKGWFRKAAGFSPAKTPSEALDKFLAGRSERPTSRTIGLWLESLFGSDRAMLKKAIAQGNEVEAALNRLPSFDGDRVPFGESTDRAPSRAAGGARHGGNKESRTVRCR